MKQPWPWFAALAVLGACTLGERASAAPAFYPNASVQAPKFEAKWPPIDEPSFRAALLDVLLRGGFGDLSTTPRDVTSRFSASMARYCDMPPATRASVLALEFSRVTPERYNEQMKVLHDNCGLRVFASERNGQLQFVAVYGKRRTPLSAGDRVFAAKQGRHTLAVGALQIPAVPAGPFVQAATARARQLTR